MNDKSNIIFSCSNITVKDVEEFFILYPMMPIQQIKIALKIGIGCGCCHKNECPATNSYFEDVINNLKLNAVLNTYYVQDKKLK